MLFSQFVVPDTVITDPEPTWFLIKNISGLAIWALVIICPIVAYILYRKKSKKKKIIAVGVGLLIAVFALLAWGVVNALFFTIVDPL